MVEPPELKRPRREQVYRRRLVALAVVLIVLGACAWAGVALLQNHRKTAPPPTTVVAPKILKVLFPEGYNRAEMAAQAHAVSPAISAVQYLSATDSSALPGKFAGDGKRRNLEGFLFPATYDMYDNDHAPRLVKKQLAAFTHN